VLRLSIEPAEDVAGGAIGGGAREPFLAWTAAIDPRPEKVDQREFEETARGVSQGSGPGAPLIAYQRVGGIVE
jgi:hypothetical protein